MRKVQTLKPCCLQCNPKGYQGLQGRPYSERSLTTEDSEPQAQMQTSRFP